MKRAISANTILNQANSEVLGLGKDILLYNNDIPEGRFYCRTVNITVETPIK